MCSLNRYGVLIMDVYTVHVHTNRVWLCTTAGVFFSFSLFVTAVYTLCVHTLTAVQYFGGPLQTRKENQIRTIAGSHCVIFGYIFSTHINTTRGYSSFM